MDIKIKMGSIFQDSDGFVELNSFIDRKIKKLEKLKDYENVGTLIDELYNTVHDIQLAIKGIRAHVRSAQGYDCKHERILDVRDKDGVLGQQCFYCMKKL